MFVQEYSPEYLSGGTVMWESTATYNNTRPIQPAVLLNPNQIVFAVSASSGGGNISKIDNTGNNRARMKLRYLDTTRSASLPLSKMPKAIVYLKQRRIQQCI